MGSFYDRQLKAAKAATRAQQMFAQSGATSATYIGADGKEVRLGAQKAPLKPFQKMTNEELDALSADDFKKAIQEQEKMQIDSAIAYLTALKVPVPGEFASLLERNAYDMRVHETVNYTIPYLRFLKALAVYENVTAVNDPKVLANSDFWTFDEFKKLTTQQRETLEVLVLHTLTRAGLQDYIGIER